MNAEAVVDSSDLDRARRVCVRESVCGSSGCGG